MSEKTRVHERPRPDHRPPLERIRLAKPSIRLLVIALILALVGTVWGAASVANAGTVTGRGIGYVATGGGFWLGSWQLDDGRRAFCVNTERSTPNGATFTPVDGADWYTPDVAAQLAYLSREFAQTDDRVTAAAAQIATWSLTGLGTSTIEDYAARAGADGEAVLARTRQVIDQARTEATRSVTAQVQLTATTVRVDLIVDSVTRGSVAVEAGRHTGTVTLEGATFADGSVTRQVLNGETVDISPISPDAVVTAKADATFAALPYGSALTMGESDGDAQNLLIAAPATASAAASVSTTVPSPKPFRPQVSTVTSAAEAVPGAQVHDTITVTAAPASTGEPTPSDPATPDSATPDTTTTDTTTTGEWAVYQTPDGSLAPVPVVVRSRLLGPFSDPIVEAATAPSDAPVTCEVEVLISTGPGEYNTPGCSLPSPGYYVWVETITPADTSAEQGGTRILPWSSRFGVASEITRATAPVPPPAAPAPPAAQVAPPLTLAETGAPGESAPLLGASISLLALGAAALVMTRMMQRRAVTSRSSRSARS